MISRGSLWLPLAILLLLVHRVSQFWLAVPGVLAYGGLCLLFRCVDRDDLSLLSQALGDKWARKVSRA